MNTAVLAFFRFTAAINEHFRYIKFFLEADGDLAAAYEDILRLQKVYRIPVSSLARGWWGPTRTRPLNITDIITIAQVCLDREDMEGALEWLLQVRACVWCVMMYMYMYMYLQIDVFRAFIVCCAYTAGEIC